MMAEKERFEPRILLDPSVLEQKDTDSINDLLKQLSETDKELSRHKVTDILCQPNCRVIILKDPATHEVIGMASLYYYKTLNDPDGIGRVEDVVVDGRYRGKGLGKLLMGYILSMARNLKLKTLELTSNPKRIAANKMYLELGFEKYDTNYYTKDL